MHPARTARWLTAGAIAIGVIALVPNAVATTSTPAAAADSVSARAVVRDVNNANLGVVTIQATRGGALVITGRLSGLTPGFHGFHIHAVGVCDPAATDATGAVVPFASAGGHLNPAGVGHGHHAGDLPLLFVTDDGTTRSVTESDMTAAPGRPPRATRSRSPTSSTPTAARSSSTPRRTTTPTSRRATSPALAPAPARTPPRSPPATPAAGSPAV
jgi:superoxide dismutase, Cu-Zn family